MKRTLKASLVVAAATSGVVQHATPAHAMAIYCGTDLHPTWRSDNHGVVYFAAYNDASCPDATLIEFDIDMVNAGTSGHGHGEGADRARASTILPAAGGDCAVFSGEAHGFGDPRIGTWFPDKAQQEKCAVPSPC